MTLGAIYPWMFHLCKVVSNRDFRLEFHASLSSFYFEDENIIFSDRTQPMLLMLTFLHR
ncbi:hypothetical protein [Nostoc sp. NOS(2021)]|uniref:hypothetical protein n=1 Tax=Nostoc sp. NOS(2021) TaxID=2815407 RepID=UPI0025F629CC|nr:hypothetical protein [Nostoc sp. NOS(2021)]